MAPADVDNFGNLKEYNRITIFSNFKETLEYISNKFVLGVIHKLRLQEEVGR